MKDIVRQINQTSKIYQACFESSTHIHVLLRDGQVHIFGKDKPRYGSFKYFDNTKFKEIFNSTATFVARYNHMQATCFLENVKRDPNFSL